MAYYLFNFTKKGAKRGVPLREQAAELLQAKLWGIGPTTANRGNLKPGDVALIYVGAPEKEFIGHATLASETHKLTPHELSAYPKANKFGLGVSFAETKTWKRPVPLASVWPGCPSAEKNPNAQFFGGVVRISKQDFEVISAHEPKLEEDSALSIAGPKEQSEPVPVSPSSSQMEERLLETALVLDKYLSASNGQDGKLTETATRSNFIDPVIKALGYDPLTEVQYEFATPKSGTADFVLSIDGKPEIVIEAKALGEKLGAKEAGQAAKYSSSMGGARWAVVTDGRIWRIYDSDMQGVAPEERMILDVDLASATNPEDFSVTVVPAMQLLSRAELANGATGLKERSAREAIRETLIDPSSATVQHLAEEIKDKRKLHLSTEEIATITSELLS